MKRLGFFTFLLVAIILAANWIYYSNLYNKQVDYIKQLLSQQVQLIGVEAGDVNLYFSSDIARIFFEEKENMGNFFSDEYSKERIIERLKFFYSKYEDFVVNIEITNNKAQVYNLYRDQEEEWIENTYLSQTQKPIVNKEMITANRDNYDAYFVIIDKHDDVIGNVIVTVDYINYFDAQFRKYKLEDYQWQWLIDEEGNILYINYLAEDYQGVRNSEGITIGSKNSIHNDILEEISGNIVHKVSFGQNSQNVISSYYPVSLLRRDFGMVFSAPTSFYQKYIIRNSLLIVSCTMLLVALLIFFYRKHIKKQDDNISLLKNSEETYINLIEMMPVGIVIMNDNKEILKANSAVAKMFSYKSVEEMEGKLMPENNHSGEGLMFSENLGAGYEPNQFMIIRKESADTVIYRKEIPVKYNGQDVFMVVLVDVTLMEIARKQEARANEAKSEFLARMSHEIRTPLNGIIGMADILAASEQTEETRELVDLIKSSSDLLLGIINDLLDFSRLEAGRLMLDEIPFDIRKEIDYCLNVTGALKPDRVNIITEISENVPLSLIGDPFRLRQVITNLLTISSEHTKAGEIRIQVNIEGLSENSQFLKIAIIDTGSGYSNSGLKKTFGDYLLKDSKVLTSDNGKGLIGVISRQLIEMMGGTLNTTTPSGLSDDSGMEGAQFVFTVKVYSNERITKKSGAEGIKKYSEIKTLVVSSGKNRDEELMNSLHKFGITTYVTSWQKQTINLLKSNIEQDTERYRFLIIIDNHELDGFDVAKQIWENNIYREIEILMLSSNDKRGNYSRCIKYGIDDYLVKPFHISELFNIIQNRFPNIDQETGIMVLDDNIKKLRVLVVEDNMINQKVASAIFNSMGLRAEIAGSGEEAVKMAAENDYDIIFMDLIMPGMDGFETAREILAKNNHMFIVALTADSTGDAARKAELTGMKGFISKPVKMEDIKKLLLEKFTDKN